METCSGNTEKEPRTRRASQEDAVGEEEAGLGLLCPGCRDSMGQGAGARRGTVSFCLVFVGPCPSPPCALGSDVILQEG